MGDTDISHAVEERLSAIEARLDALDGGPDTEEETDGEDGENGETEVEPATTRRRGRKAQAEETVVTDETEVSY